MLLNPKVYRFGANEQHILKQALRVYIKNQERRIMLLTTSSYVDSAQMDKARAQDLLTTLEK